MTQRLSLNQVPGTTEPDAIEGLVRQLGLGTAPKGQHAPRNNIFVLPCTDPATLAEDGERKNPNPMSCNHDAAPALHERSWYRTAKGRLVLLTSTLLAPAWLIDMLTSAEAGC
ncbi:hypothetical protein [Paracoccus sp. (in: a-proteobacteria)]|uniref:hypothetical protein n=1 Tax=Paracoccus sp. TaxID=267 RepID=UPI00396CD833